MNTIPDVVLSLHSQHGETSQGRTATSLGREGRDVSPVAVLLPFLLLVTVLLLAGCTAVAAVPAAPEIHYGEDMCSDCGMIINDPRFAASYAVVEGENSYQTFIFDDIGDMLHHMQQNLTLKGAGWWVHDYESEEWIDATAAFYVASEGIKSPMNHGLAAFTTRAAAETVAVEFGGKVLDWDKVRVEHAMSNHH